MTDDREKKKSDYRGVFYYIDDDGEPSDVGLVDELLVNDEEITADLIRLGIIRDMRIRLPKKS